MSLISGPLYVRSARRPFPEVNSSQHPSPLLNSHHFRGRGGASGPDRETPTGLRVKHFHGAHRRRPLRNVLRTGPRARGGAPASPVLARFGGRFRFYHIKDAANCLIIQFRGILPRLHKTVRSVYACVCLNLAGVGILANASGSGLSRRPFDSARRFTGFDGSRDALPERLSSAARSDRLLAGIPHLA